MSHPKAKMKPSCWFHPPSYWLPPFLPIKRWIKNRWKTHPDLPLQQKEISPINFKVASCHPPSPSLTIPSSLHLTIALHHPMVHDPQVQCLSPEADLIHLPVKSVGLIMVGCMWSCLPKNKCKIKKMDAKNNWQSQPSQPSIWKAFLIYWVYKPILLVFITIPYHGDEWV